jgi:hypothetical protein
MTHTYTIYDCYQPALKSQIPMSHTVDGVATKKRIHFVIVSTNLYLHFSLFWAIIWFTFIFQFKCHVRYIILTIIQKIFDLFWPLLLLLKILKRVVQMTSSSRPLSPNQNIQQQKTVNGNNQKCIKFRMGAY